MAEYQLTETDGVIRTVDDAYIPNEPTNRGWQEYQAWVEGGGVPDAYVPPPVVEPVPTPEQAILFDHENRIRTFEGQPPLSLGEFTKKLNP